MMTHEQASSVSDQTIPPAFKDGKSFRGLTELVPDFVAVIDLAGDLSYVSPAIERLLGYLPGEVIGASLLTFIHPEDQNTEQHNWARLLASDEIVPSRFRFRHKDGSYRDLETLSKNYSGTPEGGGVLVSIRDITERVENEDALRSASVEVSDLYNNAPCGYHSLDENGTVVRINDTALRWLGREREELVSKVRFSELLSSAGPLIFERCLAIFNAQGWVDSIELELVRKDGSVMPVLLSASGEEKPFVMSRSTLYDITERKLAESALRKVNRALRVQSAVGSELIHAGSEAEMLQNICRICVELGGYRQAWVGFAAQDVAKTVSVVAESGFEEGHLAHAEMSWADNALGSAPTGAAIRSGVVQVNRDILADPSLAPWHEDARRCAYRSSISLPLKDVSGPFGALMIYAEEADAFDPAELRQLEEVAADLAFGLLTLRARKRHKRAEEKIEHLAFFDQMTGLPNRNKLLDEVWKASESQPSGGASLALLNLNIVRFSDILSGIGVRKADDLLRQLASRLQQALQEGELLARTGDDEFAVLLPGGDASQARACGKRIEQALTPPFEQSGIQISVKVRIGAAIAPDDGVDPETLLLRSGIAARLAKKRGEMFGLYGGPSDAESPRHLVLISELQAAIEARQLLLHYQPKVNLASGRLAGVEALVRWRHPERGLIPPGQFVPLAEQTGLIGPLTYSVLDMAMEQCHIWITQGYPMRVAVNVSVTNFKDPEFLEKIDAILEKWKVGPEMLQLEITEDVLMEEPAQTLDLLVRLKDRGIGVTIDDFGTGYSSLNYVASFPIQALKIDRSFVIKMIESTRTRSVVAATIDLAHSLGIPTVAEGVETKEQAEVLIDMGCNQIQGFLFSKPVEAEELARWAEGFSLENYGLRKKAG